MSEGGSVTLILYKVNQKWYTEPFLNVVSALATQSPFTHSELAIGSEPGNRGSMSNVARIFNDPTTGVELISRTGRNSNYIYIQIGCTKRQEESMLRYARAQVSKPFSQSGMIRSVIWPRTTDETSFFCAELTAAILRHGGLMSKTSNPGAATPESLFRMYHKEAAVTANPFSLRDIQTVQALTSTSLGPTSSQSEETKARLREKAIEDAKHAKPVGNLIVISQRNEQHVPSTIQLTLNSLDMRRNRS